jgi:hypothetical protein
LPLWILFGKKKEWHEGSLILWPRMYVSHSLMIGITLKWVVSYLLAHYMW